MFAIYPQFDKKEARNHAVVFTECPDLAKAICHHISMERGLTHEAYLVLDSWPDPQLMNNLNGCGEEVHFSVRKGKSAHKASMYLFPFLKRIGRCDPIHLG